MYSYFLRSLPSAPRSLMFQMLIMESLLGVVVAFSSVYICVYLINNWIKAVVRGSNLSVMKGKMSVSVSRITLLAQYGSFTGLIESTWLGCFISPHGAWLLWATTAWRTWTFGATMCVRSRRSAYPVLFLAGDALEPRGSQKNISALLRRSGHSSSVRPFRDTFASKGTPALPEGRLKLCWDWICSHDFFPSAEGTKSVLVLRQPVTNYATGADLHVQWQDSFLT